MKFSDKNVRANYNLNIQHHTQAKAYQGIPL
jgi:hypothetical protein